MVTAGDVHFLAWEEVLLYIPGARSTKYFKTILRRSKEFCMTLRQTDNSANLRKIL